jgi:hypothetical protein
MLQEDQVTSAPKATNVSINTAVWIVMCKHPAMRAPANGLDSPYSARSAIKPGISASAKRISLRPQSARAMSFTLYGVYGCVVVDIYFLLLLFLTLEKLSI